MSSWGVKRNAVVPSRQDRLRRSSSRPSSSWVRPNALTPEEVGPFLVAMRDRHPQHLGMVALGFATGWRPSMMRPLRRKGSLADVLWDKHIVLARRSQTRGEEVRETTKNATRFRVTLPADVMAVLRWHTEHLPDGAMQESDLLFPSETGGFRSPTVLDKPFKDVCRHLSLGKKVTPRAMRRTFQDLARQASVNGLVQRSICGHLTEEMTERYSRSRRRRLKQRSGRSSRSPATAISCAALVVGREVVGKWWETGSSPLMVGGVS